MDYRQQLALVSNVTMVKAKVHAFHKMMKDRKAQDNAALDIYSLDNITRRSQLAAHPLVVAQSLRVRAHVSWWRHLSHAVSPGLRCVSQYWELCTADKLQELANKDGDNETVRLKHRRRSVQVVSMSKSEYEALYGRAIRVLSPDLADEQVEEALTVRVTLQVNALVQALTLRCVVGAWQEDWAEDTEGRDSLSYQEFHTSLFQLCGACPVLHVSAPERASIALAAGCLTAHLPLQTNGARV